MGSTYCTYSNSLGFYEAMCRIYIVKTDFIDQICNSLNPSKIQVILRLYIFLTIKTFGVNTIVAKSYVYFFIFTTSLWPSLLVKLIVICYYVYGSPHNFE